MKSSQSNFNLQLPSSYLARSYLIATLNDLGLNVTNFIFVKKFKHNFDFSDFGSHLLLHIEKFVFVSRNFEFENYLTLFCFILTD